MCVYQLVTHSVGRKRRIKHVLNENTAPKVVIVMPCYKEVPEILLRTVDSFADCDYPPSCLHIFLSFDGDQEDDLYLNTIEKLGVPMTLKSYPKSIDIVYRGLRITVSRFPHGGKRSCQKKTFRLIDKVYADYIKRHDNLFVLFIDSDCILDKVCIQNFVYEMELKPGSKQNMLAMTGVITSTTEKNTLLTILQDMEYIHGQLFERSVESGCGAVTCLPGALTILRFSAFRKMAKYYFADKAEQCDDLFDYGKCHLGEDRWLTHLFMVGAKERYQIQMNTGAFCKTEAVQTFKSLLKQRRRWFLGFITNEVCMLTDIRLWKQYPILLIVRFAQNTIRTTALLFFILFISLITTAQSITQLPIGFIAVSLGLNWALMMYFGAKLGRYKIMLYPLMFIINPFFNWMYMVYGIFTAGQRTWGGPRADAGAADTHVSPQTVIEQAEATGDDLNVVPETFKPALEAVTRRKSQKTTVQPSDRLEGQFATMPALAESHNRHDEEARHSLETSSNSRPASRRHSDESWNSDNTMNHSVYNPRRVESFMGPQDVRLYQMARAAQRPAGGSFFNPVPDARYNAVPTTDNEKGDINLATTQVPLSRSRTVPRSTSRPRRPSAHRVSTASSFASNTSDSDLAMPTSHNPFATPAPRVRYYSRERSPLSNPVTAPALASTSDSRARRTHTQPQMQTHQTPVRPPQRQTTSQRHRTTSSSDDDGHFEMSNLDGAGPAPRDRNRNRTRETERDRGRNRTPRSELEYAPPTQKSESRPNKLRKRSVSTGAAAAGAGALQGRSRGSGMGSSTRASRDRGGSEQMDSERTGYGSSLFGRSRASRSGSAQPSDGDAGGREGSGRKLSKTRRGGGGNGNGR